VVGAISRTPARRREESLRPPVMEAFFATKQIN
jgi:hypothetical protein